MQRTDAGVLELIFNPTFLGVAALVAVGTYFFIRDIKNPERAASNSILSEVVGNTSAVYEMAEGAFKMATEANKNASECERRNVALVRYNMTLTGQLVQAGITPEPPPPELLG